MQEDKKVAPAEEGQEPVMLGPGMLIDLKQVYWEARKAICLTDNVQESEAKVIDRLVKCGSYINMSYPKTSTSEEATTPEHEDDRVIDEYRTAVRWMFLIIVGLVILNLFGIFSV